MDLYSFCQKYVQPVSILRYLKINQNKFPCKPCTYILRQQKHLTLRFFPRGDIKTFWAKNYHIFFLLPFYLEVFKTRENTINFRTYQLFFHSRGLKKSPNKKWNFDQPKYKFFDVALYVAAQSLLQYFEFSQAYRMNINLVCSLVFIR